jgi:hypothetical protein
MANNTAEESGLTFPERHWLLLCILVAILSPLVVHWIQGAVDKKNYGESLEQRTVQGGMGGSTPSGGAVAPGDTSRPGGVNPMASPSVHTTTKDTTYRVAAPPQNGSPNNRTTDTTKRY